VVTLSAKINPSKFQKVPRSPCDGTFSLGAVGLTRAVIARKTKKQMASTPPEEAGERAVDGYEDSMTRLAC